MNCNTDSYWFLCHLEASIMDTQRALKRTIWSDTLKRLVTELKNKFGL
jgi:hypothetical protein